MEETLLLGKIDGKRRWGRQRMRWLESITNSMDISLSKLQETVEERGAHGVAKSQNPGKEHPLIEFRSLYVSAGRE